MERKYDNERSPEAVEYLRRIVAMGQKWGFKLAHEDDHGAFIVMPRTQDDVTGGDAYEDRWLLAASEED